MALGFNGKAAAAISIIGGADGPTSIFLAGKLAADCNVRTDRSGGIFLYVTGSDHPAADHEASAQQKKERKIKMDQLRPVSKLEKILFPIIITIVVCLILPTTAPLVGMLMLGNLFKECGVVRQLTETASNALMYIVVILLGTSVGATTSAEAFLNCDTLKIVVLGLVAFAFGTAADVLFGKLMCKLTHGKSKPADRFRRCICGTYGSPCIPESGCRGRSYKLPSDARDGPERCRCYRYSRSSRNIHGYFRSITKSSKLSCLYQEECNSF